MNCPKCGNPISPNTKFCAKCGTPVPQKPPVQPTYPQNNPPKVQPQRAQRNAVNPQQQKPPAPQSFVTPQPTPQSFAVQPQNPPKKKKSNKNLPLIIVAAALVLAVLASTIAVVPGIIRNKNEINAATEYIEEFPTLKQKTSLLVYDINKFPSEKYEIKVEKMFMGGVLNGVFKGKTILEDVSTEQIYDIDFKEDGDYRITLTDKTDKSEENTGSSSENKTEVIEIIIIIDVKVDNDAEDSVDNVDLNADVTEEITEPSEQDSANKFLEATDEDFKDLALLLENLQDLGTSFEFSSTETDAYKTLLYELSNQHGHIFIYNYFFGEYGEFVDTAKGSLKNDIAKMDPLNKFGNYYAYNMYNADKLDWIIENVFNVTPDRNDAMIEDEYGTQLYYYEGSYYVASGDSGGGGVGYLPVMKSTHVDQNFIYTVEYDLIEEYGNGERNGTYRTKCALKDIDGKKQWSLFEIEKVPIIPEDAKDFNGHKYKAFDQKANWHEAYYYCESLGGHLATITSEEEQRFIVDEVLPGEPKNCYWIGGNKNDIDEWTWLTGEDFRYTNWAENEPNNIDSYEGFIQMFGKRYDGGAGIKYPGDWNDASVDGAEYSAYFYSLDNTGFICEWE